MLLLLIPVLMIIWGFWWIRKPPVYPKNPDNLGNFFIGYRTQWALKSPDTWLYSHVRYSQSVCTIVSFSRDNLNTLICSLFFHNKRSHT